jgi:hypothetical protein
VPHIEGLKVSDAAGCISLAEEYLRTTLADCAAFRVFVGAAGPSQARERIHLDTLPAPDGGADEHPLSELQELRPFAIVYTAEVDGLRATADAVSDAREFHYGGRLGIHLERDVPPEIAGDPQEVSRTFKNAVGQIIDGLAALAGTAGYLDSQTISLSAGPLRAHPDNYPTEGDHQWAIVEIEWG